MEPWSYDLLFNYQNYELSSPPTPEAREESNRWRKAIGRLDNKYAWAVNLTANPNLQREYAAIRTQVCLMISRKTPVEEIERYIDQSLPRLEACVNNYNVKNREFTRFQNSQNQKHIDLQQKISSATTDSSPFVLPKVKTASAQEILERLPGYWDHNDVKEKIQQDPAWPYKKAQVEKNMAIAEMASKAKEAVKATAQFVGDAMATAAKTEINAAKFVAETVGLGVKQQMDSLKTAAEVIGGVVNSGVQQVCQINETTKSACQSVKDIGNGIKDGFVKVKGNIAEFQAIKKIKEAANKEPVSLPQHLEQEYLIPREQGKKYASNGYDLLMTAGKASMARSSIGVFKWSSSFFESYFKSPIKITMAERKVINNVAQQTAGSMMSSDTVSRNFVLIKEPLPKILSSVELTGNYPEGKFFTGIASKLDNKSTIAYVGFIGNPITKNPLHKNFTGEVINIFKGQAIFQGSKELILECEFVNPKLFKLMKKTYEYVGRSKANHLGRTLCLESASGRAYAPSVHRFKIPLNNPSGSMVDDRKLLNSTK